MYILYLLYHITINNNVQAKKYIIINYKLKIKNKDINYSLNNIGV